MAATFDYVLRYAVTATCETPLRCGGTDGDPESVLRGRDGRLFIQGSSLCGALRSRLEQTDGRVARLLFGTQDREGRLAVSDGVFDADASVGIRPRLCIDGATASAAKGKKFDMACIPRGARFAFTLTLYGNGTPESAPETERGRKAVCALLSELHTGLIRLGAQKSNGFGRVKLQVRQRAFDLTDRADRSAWLSDATDGSAPLALAEAAQSEDGSVRFLVKARTDGILVKASAPTYSESPSDDVKARSYTANYAENGVPILPGSSVKGAVRARTESIAAYLGVPELPESMFGRMPGESDNGLPGRVYFEDVLLDPNPKNRKVVSRIRINRLTAGVISGGLFQEEPLRSDVTFRVSVPAAQRGACALLLYALRDLGLGLYTLGSGWAVGYGRLAVDRIEIRHGSRGAELVFSNDGDCTLRDPDGMTGEWLKELEECKHES